MINSNDKKLVDDVFIKILEAESIDDLSNIIIQNDKIKKNQINGQIYPVFKWTLTSSEISELKKKGILDERGVLTETLGNTELTSLEKLLYSIIWKNRDLGKERHIVDGIESCNKEELTSKENGFVFYHFGKHLADRKEPIIDQHVLRAYGIYKCQENELDKITNYQEKETITSNDINLIKDYKKWLISEEINEKLRNVENYFYHIDKVLFSLGKTVKTKKPKKPKST